MNQAIWHEARINMNRLKIGIRLESLGLPFREACGRRSGSA